MKHLTLIRHAKSSWNDPDLDDFDRPLNSRGRKNAPEMGRRLAEQGLLPDAMVTSPALRAVTTAQLIAEEIGFACEQVQCIDSLYAADVSTLLHVIQSFDDELNDVFLVGHNPGLTRLANTFIPDLIDNLPTCGILRLDLFTENWQEARPGQAALIFYDFPKRVA